MRANVSREMAVSSGTRRRDRERDGRLRSVVQRSDLWLALLFTVALLLEGLYFAGIQNIWIQQVGCGTAITNFN